ncbi:SSS family solute:Na+ symporter [Rhizomicrobium palustre]|uniref:SSS family solute:Na+ symporter n=1 Tax=Rhizomicrobium palustre TaxID=189966 RepID=A0A846MVW3_9PROT|nr:sodium/solute symporter [Rhizomicrobium palustre]NIK87301.1 SSS family solute:Na+ symporter [Rhizomicrobium palustre]
MHLRLFDIVIIIIYAILVLTVARLFHRQHTDQDDFEDRAPAQRPLPWWAIGTSLIAANISAEQIIGMSASAFALGLGIAGYEWLAAVAMLVAGKYFLPVFLKHRITTMPQFLRLRYGAKTQVTMAVFWILLYTFVSLTAIMWLGANAVHTITGLSLTMSVVLLGLVAGNYALYVGLKATHFTDVVQVSALVLGGLVMSIYALESIGTGKGLWAGFVTLQASMPDHFHMILKPDDPYYKYLPGLASVGLAMWVLHFSYWGFNQGIVQRALAATNVREVQKGIVLAAFLKLLMPLIVVLPGLAAAYLIEGMPTRADEAYPLLMTMLPSGLLGFVFVALMAAIISSTGSTLSSIAKIFTSDVVQVVYPQASKRLSVILGPFTAIAALMIAMAVATPLLDRSDQAFQYIQEFTGFVSPGVVVIFMMGLFWPRANETGALLAAGTSVFGSAFYALIWPGVPFLTRMADIFLICMVVAAAGSLLTRPAPEKRLDLKGVDFTTARRYNLASALIAMILIGLYWYFW